VQFLVTENLTAVQQSIAKYTPSCEGLVKHPRRTVKRHTVEDGLGVLLGDGMMMVASSADSAVCVPAFATLMSHFVHFPVCSIPSPTRR
jgi:hypothetical protein